MRGLKTLSADLPSVFPAESISPPSSSMKFLVSRSLIVKLSYYFSPFNTPLLRPHPPHSAAGDKAYEPRNDRGHAFSSSSSKTQHDEDNKNVKVTVWWDFENCSIPKGANAHLVKNRIISAIRSSGIEGPVTAINAFGDVARLPHATQQALTSTGISLRHVPHCGKNSADRYLMADIVCWVSQNPPPAHFFLISGDGDFANIMHRLGMGNYNILIACTGSASWVLLSAATVRWPWSELVKGENFLVPTTSQPEESKEPISEPKIRPIPKAVVIRILQVLHSYPEGISLSVLRTELKRNNITIDKDFYGHKYFSQFLGALNLLKAMPPPAGGGQLGPLKKGAEQPSVSPSKHDKGK